jgi:hypothetical protein
MKTTSLSLAALLVLPLAGWSAEKGGTHLKIDELPAVVKATIEKESAGAKVEEIEKETEGGKTFYEAEIVKNGHRSYIHVSPDGKVLKRETAAQERKAEGAEKEGHERHNY